MPPAPCEELAGLGHIALALGPLLGDELLDLLVLARVQGGEGQVLELPLDRVDPEPVGQRGEDLERLARLLLLLVLVQRIEGAHVVEAVGQLDQDHPDVGGHRHHHLPVVLGLALIAALEGDLGQLGDAVHELGDLVPEALPHLLQARARVLDRVVQQGRAQGRGVQAQPGADPRDAEGVGDEVLAGLPFLAGVALAGEREGALDLLALDRLGQLGLVLGDDGEEVAQQGALLVAQLAGDRVGTGGAAALGGLAHAQVTPGDRRPSAARCSALQESLGLLVPGDAGDVRPRSLKLGLLRG